MADAAKSASVKERRQTYSAPAAGMEQQAADIDPELARVLEGKRWEKREEPFQGFGSPEGKF